MPDADGRIRPSEATHRSQCPFAPSDPRWKEWQQAFLYYRKTDPGVLSAQIERMNAVRASVRSQRTERQVWHDQVMDEIEAYNDWKETGQGADDRIVIFNGEKVRVNKVSFTPLDNQNQPIASNRLSWSLPSIQSIPTIGSVNIGQFSFDEPDEPDLFDDLYDAFKALSQAFSLSIDAVTDIVTNMTKVFQDFLDAAKAKKEAQGRAFIPEKGWYWQSEDYDAEALDQRPHIRQSTWLQYDSIDRIESLR